MDPGLEFEAVSYRYGRTVALHDVTLAVDEGILGLLGPNGAGKSTLLSLAATLLAPQQGTVRVLGRDVSWGRERQQARALIGVLPQRFKLVASMRVRDTVAYAAWINGVDSGACRSRASSALERVGLADRGAVRVRQLSGGQRQRVGIAAAIAHDPKLLILDEATVGVDPVARVQLRRYLREIAAGRTVVVSTHLVEDVVRLCERVVVINRGSVVYDGGTSALAATVEEDDDAAALASPLEAAYERLLVADSAHEPA